MPKFRQSEFSGHEGCSDHEHTGSDCEQNLTNILEPVTVIFCHLPSSSSSKREDQQQLELHPRSAATDMGKVGMAPRVYQQWLQADPQRGSVRELVDCDQRAVLAGRGDEYEL